jgi:hypothetical protein
MNRVIRTAIATLLTATALTSGSAITSATAQAQPARSVGIAGPKLVHPEILAHFDLAGGQLPENIVLDENGAVDLSFAGSRQVARITSSGHTRVLATLPAPSAADGANTPVMHFALTTGLVRTPDGTLYVLYAAGGTLTGLWKIPAAGGTARQIAYLPGDGLPNGLALSADHRYVYAADSVLGAVHRIRLSTGTVTTWAKGKALEPSGFLGANGVKVHRGFVWVSNLDQGTLLRIPLTTSGGAGTPTVAARGLVGIDDFAFTGHGDTLIAALNQPNTIDIVQPGSGHRTVLTAADGLQGPTAVAVRGTTVYLPSAAYNTGTDPNLLTATLHG